MKGHRYMQGLTMIELLVTISIVAILAALALPAFNNLLTSNRAQAQAGLLFRSLNYARSEAVRRSATIAVAPLSGSNWGTAGWMVWVDADGDDTFDSGEEELQRQPALTGGSTITASRAVISFLPSGYRKGSTGFNASDETFLYAMGTGNSYCTSIAHSGRVSYEKKATCP